MSLNYRGNSYRGGVSPAFRSPIAASAAIGLHARYDALFANRYHTFAAPLSVEAAERYRQRLDALGYEQICEAIAEGRLPAEIALHLGVPLMVFREWLDRCPEELLDAAMRSHAEMSILKAEMTLSLAPPDRCTADVQVALADHFHKRAEKLHPSRWGTQRDRVAAGVQINFSLPPEVPGLDHMRPKNTLDLPVTKPFEHMALSVETTDDEQS